MVIATAWTVSLNRYDQGWRGGALDNPIGHTAEVKVGFAAPAGHYDKVDVIILDQFKKFSQKAFVL